MQKITITWTDGHSHTGETWRELERLIRDEQWHRYTRFGFRREMARRAEVWSRTRISILGTAERFLRELERAGMCRVSVETLHSQHGTITTWAEQEEGQK